LRGDGDGWFGLAVVGFVGRGEEPMAMERGRKRNKMIGAGGHVG
jgi:hypothetical protein